MEQPLKILLVEDDEDDYELTKELLGSQIAQTKWVQTLAAALKLLNEEAFDVLLLDLGIPDSQGLATFDMLIRELDYIPVVVVLTGNDDEQLAREALLRGAQDYLLKGQVNKELLMRSLRYAIERHKAESQLRKSNDELVALNHALVAARDAALDASRLKSEFLANISHEIRTPLSGIVSVIELVGLEECSPQVTELLEVLETSSKQLVETLNDLLDLSKLEAGKMQVNNIDCDIRQIIKDVVTTVEPTAKRKRIALEFKVDESLPEFIWIDEVRLKQILLNFAHNAVKFTESGAIKIKVVCESDPAKSLYITVQDTGIGISEESQKRIFEPFTQADGSMTRRFGGTGLGLTISKKSAELLGGTLGVDSEEGKGSTFWLKIPIEHIHE